MFALALLCLLLGACQGTSTGTGGPRPRSREASGTNPGLPFEAVTKNRKPVDQTGGEVEYRLAKLVIPREALDEPVFVEIAVPQEAQNGPVLPQSVYEISPDSLELKREALLTLTYYDDDIPAGKDEDQLVIVQKVNNVWVELSNSRVHPHANNVEAPIRFFGIYALRIASGDPRILNSMPVASFEFSDKPYPNQHGDTVSAARAKQAAKKKEQAQTQPSPGGTGPDANPPATPGAPSPGGTPGAPSPGGTPGTPSPGGTGGAPTPGSTPGTPHAVLFERRVVGGPAKTGKPKGKGKGKSKSTSAAAGKTGSQAEGPATVSPGLSDAELLKRRENDQLNSAAGSGAPPAPPATGAPPAALPGATGPAGPAEGIAEAEAPKPRFGPAPGQVSEVKGEGADVTVYFNAEASSDPDGIVVQYDWDWDGDGVFDYTSHSSAYAEHTFQYNGDYSVVLKVTDDGRYAQSSYAVGTVEVRSAKAGPQPLAANISSFPPSGPVPLTVHFAATVTGGTAPYVYKWTFSDGSSSNLPNPFITYAEVGSYTVHFSVTDIKGEMLDGTLGVSADDRDAPGTPRPRMQLALDPDTLRGAAPLAAHFKLLPERAAAPVTYRISFGDEAAGAPETVTTSTTIDHVFSNAGYYVVKIIATDSELRTASTFAAVHAYAPGEESNFTASAGVFSGDDFSFGNETEIHFDYTDASKRTVKFAAANTPRAPTQLAYNWDFGDGTYSTEASPDHTFAKDGIYEIRLGMSDGSQRWRQRIWLPVSQKGAALAIQRPPYLEGPAPLRLGFQAVTTRAEEPLRYAWSFGEASRIEAAPYFTFDKPGEYDVHLNVKDKYDTQLTAPPVTVRVRNTPPDYQLPLAVIQPLTGSTRTVVLDYTAAGPVPLSSPSVDGAAKLVGLSSDGVYVGTVGPDGLLVKQVRDGMPVLSYLPASGQITALQVISTRNGAAAVATTSATQGAATWLLRPGADPQKIGDGALAAVSGDGTLVILGPKTDGTAQPLRQYSVNPAAGQVSEFSEFGVAREVALSEDASVSFYITSDQRLVRRKTSTVEQTFLTTGNDAKRGLVCSADGRAVAFVTGDEDKPNVIYGRVTPEGDWRLVSVTDETGWASNYLALSADGNYLLTYGSRSVLASLLGKAGTPDKAGKDGRSPIDAESGATAQTVPAPPKQRERFGIVRLNLSRPPDEWTIKSVDPRFITEAGAQFSTAGPFD
jgi:PKD repeat protein